MGPYSFSVKENYQLERVIATDFCVADLDLRSGATDLYKELKYKTLISSTEFRHNEKCSMLKL